MAMDFSLDLTKIIDNRFKIGSFVGQGAYSKIFDAKDKNGSRYAVKFGINKNDMAAVSPQAEAEIMLRIRAQSQENICIPKVMHYGEHEGRGVLVMEMLGEDLNDLQDMAANQLFKYRTVFQIGYQIVDILQHVHKAGYIHTDVYAGNIVSGIGLNQDRVYLIDFGSAASPKFKKDIQHRVGTDLTSLYASHPIADLEQLGYTMIGMAKHGFSWEETFDSSVVTVNGIQGPRSDSFRRNICQGIPDMDRYFSFIDIARSSTYPDYDRLKRLIADILYRRWACSPGDPIDWSGPTRRSEGHV